MIRWLWLGSIFFSFQMAEAQNFCLKHDGKQRNFTVHLPKGYNARHSYPLVLNFHGWGGDPDQQQRYTKMNDVADKEGFIVVYPQSYRRYWNTGVLPLSYKSGNDDVGFVSALLDSLSHRYLIDQDSVYVVGVSLGGYLAQRLGCELGNKIAAFVSVSGLMSDSTKKHCSEFGTMPILYMHGTRDWLVPYRGNRIALSVEKTVDFWRKYNCCESAGDTAQIPDFSPEDKTTTQLIRYRCHNRSQVWFVKIKGGGHTWPMGGIDYWYFGKTSMDFNASQLIWEFFKQFSLKRARM